MVANKTPRLNARQDHFARLVVAGKSQAAAWRTAYGKPKARNQLAAENGSKLAAKPVVAARIAQLRSRAEDAVLLTHRDRLLKLAEAINFKPRSASDRSALARLVEVYNKTAGDSAPERFEVTQKGDAAAPVVVATVTLSKRDKIAALKAQRAPAPTEEARP